MKIFDCFTFNDENEILEIRLNELNKYVDYFVIVESGENHQGRIKGKKIDDNLINKFKSKIRYFFIDSFNKNFNSWERENFQRDYLLNGLYDSHKEDIIIISDLDEIPNLSKFDFSNLDDSVYAFNQINIMYKFNLMRDYNWIGSKLCKYKKLKSPQWLRSLKVNKKYSFFRFDKYFSKNYTFNFQIVKNGGWHFGWIKNVDEIIKKVESFAHTEYNNNKYKNHEFINDCIKKNINFLNTEEKLKEIDINLLPLYLIKKKNRFNKYFK
jgi:beta-1,4-mannosyl-glycoprotein beta-1,4-N-acetylglucosaminyltransferase